MLDYEIIPSILVPDFEMFEKNIRLVEPYVKTIQWDVLDGVFAPNTTFSETNALEKVDTRLKIEAQLMVSDPDIDLWIESDVDRIILHYESFSEKGYLEEVIEKIMENHKDVGLAINPETELFMIEPFLHYLDYILIMTVKPGYSGQKFLPEMLSKVEQLRESYPGTDIEVDGGINFETLPQAMEAGANKFVVNSAIFKSENIEEAIEGLNGLLK